METSPRTLSRWLVPLVAVAVLVGAFAGVAMSRDSQPPSFGAGGGDEGPVDNFLGHLSDELGMSEEELVAAGLRAAEATIDDAVEAGKLTREQADALEQRLNQYVKNPDSLENVLDALRRDAAPYLELKDDVQRAVTQEIAALLGVGEARLRALVRTHGVEERMRAGGVSTSEVLDAARTGAARALGEAAEEGLITRLQARVWTAKTVAIVKKLMASHDAAP